MSYVYRFIDKDYNCLYVGFSNRDSIFGRMNEHFGKEGHLPKECYDKVARIDYKEYQNKEFGLQAEEYYIKKYSPIYNTIYNKHKKGWSAKPMKIVIQEDWNILTKFGDMEEMPKFIKSLQYMYLGAVFIFGIVTLVYMISNCTWTFV